MKLSSVLTLLSADLIAASITFAVNDVQPLPLKTAGKVSSASELFTASCPEEATTRYDIFNPRDANETKVIWSSTSELQPPDAHTLNDTYPSSGSFIQGAIVAWAQHQSLVLRPDVIWFEILAQLNYYMSANAEQVRHLLVQFEGKQDILVKGDNFTEMIASFGTEIQKRVKTPWLRDWIMPGFSTSTENDKLTATIMMMGLTKEYFRYAFKVICGLPHVTLLGTREDWVALYQKLDRLEEFGPEPKKYADNLRPILKRVVQTWDQPENVETKSFWNSFILARGSSSCGKTEMYISGWITGFMHWETSGSLRRGYSHDDATQLDGVNYTSVAVDDIPIGYAKAPVLIMDFPGTGVNMNASVLAGNIGIKRTLQDTEVLAEPLASWFLYGPTTSTTGDGHRDDPMNAVNRVWPDLRDHCPEAPDYKFMSARGP